MHNDDSYEPIAWRDGLLRFLDQTRLPGEICYVETGDYRDVADAIRRLALRGAPLIGIAAAYGLALAARDWRTDLHDAAAHLTATRPTAVNLAWAVRRVLAAADRAPASRGPAVEAEARRIHAQQVEDDLRMGDVGAGLIAPGSTLLTHCNTGALATGGIGTALGVIKTAHRQGKDVRVFVDETRPLLQGARLTAWELEREGVPYRLIVDAAAAGLIAAGEVQAVVVGADRIAANGDVANKVGTYGVALAAQTHGVPLYVVAPSSTIDLLTPDGAGITIEHRDGDEVLSFGWMRNAPDGATALNPAFDITPASHISAIVTEHGVLHPPFDAPLRETGAAVAVPR
ncbi:MAG: S-methyl-5-thioribose-1-phosphate isomerase [Chloroflexota bacterium]|nr:S-methyl-5-thioribose-1-phosphate isomerase [Chloroflexota bacterium]